jgi:glycosyltransferase involved in cell wall biosynthesis
MKIEILCSDGSPMGVHYSDIFGENGRVGVGGAELALLTMCEGWTRSGHEVVLYNNPRKLNESPFEQRQVSQFNKKDKRDILIVFRTPTPKILGATGLKVWWSCDQYTTGDFSHFSRFPDRIVTISPHHSNYFSEKYGIGNSIHIDLPVRSWEYDLDVPKVKDRLIFTSVPQRGLEIVAKTFPRIRDILPNVSLVITSDYRLWGAISPLNQEYMQMFMRQRNVEFLGAIPRKRLIEEQLKAQIHFYPATYEELFCIAVAESQVAGAVPITTTIGSLATTNMGVQIDGDARDPNTQAMFVQKTVEYIQKRKLEAMQKSLMTKARERFSLERILKEWDSKVFDA